MQALPAVAYLDLELKEDTLTPADADRIASMLETQRTRESLMKSSFDPSLLIPFRSKGFTVGVLGGRESCRKGSVRIRKDPAAPLRPQFLNLPVEIVPALGMRRAAFFVPSARIIAATRWSGSSKLSVPGPEKQRILNSPLIQN